MSIIRLQLLMVYCPLLIFHSPLYIAHCSKSIFPSPLPNVRCPLSIAHYQLFIVHFTLATDRKLIIWVEVSVAAAGALPHLFLAPLKV